MVPETSFQRYLLTLRILFSLILCAAIAYYVDKSIHWQVMWDTSIMHYVNFLMAHGLAPYRDIIDINLPGSYFMEGLAMHIFGGGDLGWRLYDYTLLLILIASLIVIAWPYDWFAGLFAGTFFLLIHASNGPLDAGQREQLMITLIVAAYALLFTSMRFRKPVLLLPFGVLLGIAASLKPTSAPLGLLLLLMAAIALKKRNIKIAPYLVYGLVGMLLASLTSVGFLYKYHAFDAFVATFKRLVPYYASTGNTPKLLLVKTLFRRKYCFMIAAGAALLLVNRAEKNWEQWERLTIGLGIAFGIFSYLAQGKPFDPHAYPFIMFVLIGSSIEFCKTWRKIGWNHLVGLACILLLLVTTAPGLVRVIATPKPWSAEQDALRTDLTRLGGSNLQSQVQCFDMVSSCFSTLYHMELMPYTAFMGDYMFLGPLDSPPLPYYRTMMWDKLHASPPKIVVLTNMWLSEDYSFNKLNQWPQLAAFLSSEYTQEPTRTFGQFAYRIYVLKAPQEISTPGKFPSMNAASSR